MLEAFITAVSVSMNSFIYLLHIETTKSISAIFSFHLLDRKRLIMDQPAEVKKGPSTRKFRCLDTKSSGGQKTSVVQASKLFWIVQLRTTSASFVRSAEGRHICR